MVLVLLPAIRQVKYSYANPIFTQIQRAALSVQLNIAEGYALRTSKRFRNHVDIAYGSPVETAELLELSRAFIFFQRNSPLLRLSGVIIASGYFAGLSTISHNQRPLTSHFLFLTGDQARLSPNRSSITHTYRLYPAI